MITYLKSHSKDLIHAAKAGRVDRYFFQHPILTSDFFAATCQCLVLYLKDLFYICLTIDLTESILNQ